MIVLGSLIVWMFFFYTYITCSFHHRSDVIITPKYLCVTLNCWLPRLYVNSSGVLVFFLFFSGGKGYCHRHGLSDIQTSDMSSTTPLFWSMHHLIGPDLIRKKFPNTAHSRMQKVKKSFVKSKRKRGPRTDAWGILDFLFFSENAVVGKRLIENFLAKSTVTKQQYLDHRYLDRRKLYRTCWWCVGPS